MKVLIQKQSGSWTIQKSEAIGRELWISYNVKRTWQECIEQCDRWLLESLATKA